MNTEQFKTRKSGIALAIIGLVAIMAIAAIPVSAEGTIYVNTTDTNDAVTYDTIENAIENASSGATIKIAGGEYDTSVDVTTDNVTLEDYNTTDTTIVEINATNTDYGDALYGEYAHNVTLGSDVSISQNVVYVDIAGTAEFTSIQNAVDSVSNNTTISIEAGSEYQESVDFGDKEYIGLVNRYPSDGNVVINATNTESGDAFVSENNLRIGGYITVKEDVYAGGGAVIEDSLTSTFMGIPVWTWVIALVIVGYIYYDKSE
jgi:pectin methylesterase-like acyl-CoA thioesterase